MGATVKKTISLPPSWQKKPKKGRRLKEKL